MNNPFTRPRVRKLARYISLCLMLMAVILAAAIVGTLTIDLGPAARRTAESEGAKYMERPMRIGRLSIHLLSGIEMAATERHCAVTSARLRRPGSGTLQRPT